jgi:hypothetical protein
MRIAVPRIFRILVSLDSSSRGVGTGYLEDTAWRGGPNNPCIYPCCHGRTRARLGPALGPGRVGRSGVLEGGGLKKHDLANHH